MTHHKMRAKVKVGSIIPQGNGTETLTFFGVSKNSYTEDGSDEDNTYAKFTPSLNFQLHLANPELVGTFEVGEIYYVDFTSHKNNT